MKVCYFIKKNNAFFPPDLNYVELDDQSTLKMEEAEIFLSFKFL